MPAGVGSSTERRVRTRLRGGWPPGSSCGTRWNVPEMAALWIPGRPAAVTAVHTSEASEFEFCASQRPGLLLGGSVGARRAGALPALGLRSTRLVRGL